jgi:hypothetical protein
MNNNVQDNTDDLLDDEINHGPAMTDRYLCILSKSLINDIFPIYTFQTSMQVSQWYADDRPTVASKKTDLVLFNEIKEISKAQYTDLLQRSINKTRVDKIRKTYLDAESVIDSPKFFPPLIVILLPIDKDENFLTNYNDSFAVEKNNAVLPLEGIEAGAYRKNSWDYSKLKDKMSNNLPSTCHLAWDKNKYRAIVIDGQHRLSALRAAHKNDPDNFQTTVKVNILVFDPAHKEINLTQCTRSIFIDINNTPQKVSETNLILIDDKNIQRVSTRNLLSNKSDEQKQDKFDWLPFGDLPPTKEEYLKRKHIPKQLIDMPDWERTLQSINLGIVHTGFSGITNLNMLYKFVKDYMIHNDFDSLVNLVATKCQSETENKNYREYIDTELETQVKNKKIINNGFQYFEEAISANRPYPENLEELFKTYAEKQYLIKASETNSDSAEKDDSEWSILSPEGYSYLFQFDPKVTETIVALIFEEFLLPIITVFQELYWSKEIIQQTANTIYEIKNHKGLSIDTEKNLGYLSLFIDALTGTNKNIENSKAVKRWMKNVIGSDNNPIYEEIFLKYFGKIEKISRFTTEKGESSNDVHHDIFRTSVGQRGLFNFFMKSKNLKIEFETAFNTWAGELASNKNDHAHFYVQELNKLNQVYKGRFFKRDFQLESITIGRPDQDHIDGQSKMVIENFLLWNNIIVKKSKKDGQTKYKMIPSNSAAEKFSNLTLLFLVEPFTKGISWNSTKALFTILGRNLFEDNNIDNVDLYNLLWSTFFDDELELENPENQTHYKEELGINPMFQAGTWQYTITGFKLYDDLFEWLKKKKSRTPQGIENRHENSNCSIEYQLLGGMVFDGIRSAIIARTKQFENQVQAK